MRRKFLRRGTRNFENLGRKRKKKQKWRKARGRHNKVREKRKGRPKKVEIGFGRDKKERRRVRGKIPILVKSLKEADKIKTGDLVIIGRVGKRKRSELEKRIKEKKGEILNIIKTGR